MDFRAKERWDARKTVGEHAPTCAARSCASRRSTTSPPAPSRASTRRTRSRRATCSRPAPRRRGRRSTRWASASRSRCRRTRPTRATSSSASTATTTARTSADRAPAGVCEWNLVDEPSFHGLAVLHGRQRADQHDVPLELRRPTRRPGSSTTARSPSCRPTSRWAPEGQTPVGADVRRARHAPRTGAQGDDLAEVRRAGGRPVARRLRRPVGRRHVAGHRPGLPLRRGDGQAGRVPAVLRRLVVHHEPRHDDGFWKEVQACARTTARCCASTTGCPPASSARPQRRPVIPSRFGPDGALYMARWAEGCCRAGSRRHQDAARQDRVRRRGRVPRGHASRRRVNGTVTGRLAAGRGRHVPRVGHADGDRRRRGLRRASRRSSTGSTASGRMGALHRAASASTRPATTRSSTARRTSSATCRPSGRSTFTVVALDDQDAPAVDRRRSPARRTRTATTSRPPRSRSGPPTRCRRSPRSSTASTRRASGRRRSSTATS